ncbi:uncharacterized protein L3040_009126 [Drepanopeziza brunnea f. sp. 'multigermtubi']|uniref:uncharacterized protein n=1 Tax=Drepanopeziza brunnea f. sp. 'multigermtubi' TaxID=698441 RepID=UPI0023A62B56|nr:hypothetical protein L3040_009126 [Drepanopeziza brunnea f. sp. 'multigermtubi']
MSDATSPTPRRSSSAAPATAAAAAATTARRPSNSSSGNSGEFETCLEQAAGFVAGAEGLVDSEDRLDNKQKRKRTSPADQAVLEAEYRQNPKPNKAARADIVEKVSLNEKEVQIWFQNRRQINRRKSRPLLPHEIAAFGLRSMAAMSSDPITMMDIGRCSSQGPEEHEPSSQADTVASQEVADVEDVENEVVLQKAVESPVEPEKEVEAEVEAAVEEIAASLSPPSLPQISSGTLATDSSSISAAEKTVKSLGYLSNRWNAHSSSASTPSSSKAPTYATPPTFRATQPTSCPERIDETVPTPSSHIRLSLSLDGKATLVSTIPSPPRQYAPRLPLSSEPMTPQKRMRLQRSQSALNFGSRPSMSNAGASPLLPRLPTGRSRDARSWEKICGNAEVPDELTKQAENELSGSAVAAISLLRSSGNTALKANPNKRNAPSARLDTTKQGKKAKLARTVSSVAKLQSPSKAPPKAIQDPHEFGKNRLLRSPSGDSDKENWVPQENGASSRRKPLPSGRTDKRSKSRVVLGDNHSIPSHAVDFGGNRSRKRKPAVAQGIFEDQDENAKVGEEVESFMRGEICPSKKGDLDCIQGLLSLSQGNWR